MLQFVMASNFRLLESNFILYAMQNYDNPHCLDADEFRDDIKRIKYIKRLLNRYETTGELKERLILNHLILFYNVFRIEAATQMLFHKIDTSLRPALKTFLVYLNFMPDKIYSVDEDVIISSSIPLDTKIISRLRSLSEHERK